MRKKKNFHFQFGLEGNRLLDLRTLLNVLCKEVIPYDLAVDEDHDLSVNMHSLIISQGGFRNYYDLDLKKSTRQTTIWIWSQVYVFA